MVVASLFLAVLGVILVAMHFSIGSNLDVLDPKGIIALKQRNLILLTSLMSLLVVMPVFWLTFWIAWRYRASNTSARYTPNWDHSRTLESIWWGVPTLIIIALAGITWQSSHELDPFKPIISDKPAMRIQVVALQWKWLFIYPEQDIATVNYVQFPKNTPIDFEITSDAPMNSFWIPQLGGQVYAMAGMRTHLELMASESGTYRGSSANLSGAGFSGMRFMAKSSSAEEFDQWAQKVSQSTKVLDSSEYKSLSQPSASNPPSYYSSEQASLYDNLVMKYMEPGSSTEYSARRAGIHHE